MSQRPIPLVLLRWEEAVKLILETTESFPKNVRRHVSERLEGHALDIYEALIEARFSRTPQGLLEKVNLRLEMLRMLLRLCYERRLVGETRLRMLFEKIEETGKMVGGWLRGEVRG